jgi:hypothetical protein
MAGTRPEGEHSEPFPPDDDTSKRPPLAEGKSSNSDGAGQGEARPGESIAPPQPSQIEPASRPEARDLVTIFAGALGVGSVFLLPLNYALLTLGVAFAAMGSNLHAKKRLVSLAVAGCALAAGCLVWILGSGTDHAAVDKELIRGKVRLAIVDKVNEARRDRHLDPLMYSPSLSVMAQQRATFGAAAHTGLPASPTAGELPSSKTNMWAEMAGVSCSWHRLFDLAGLGKKVPRSSLEQPEIGFIYMGADVGPDLPLPILSKDFHSMGVGIEHLPEGTVSVVIDLVGPPRAGIPWMRSIPNLLGKVEGFGLPTCS